MSGLTLAADQLTKYLVVMSLSPGQSLPLIPSVLHLTYVQNTGAAFGLLKGRHLLFIGISLIVILWIARELLTHAAGLTSTARRAYALILGGAAGNLIDRIRVGSVIDFVDLRVWPVFNLGDSAITIGVTLLVWQSMRRHR